MFLAKDDHAVHAFPPNRTDHPFDVWILPRGSTSRNDLLDSHVPHPASEHYAEDGVAIAEQKPRLCSVGRKRLDDLLGGPLGRRMRCHVEVNDPASLMGEEYKAVQQAECGRRHDEEVAGDGAVKMVPEEGAPRLG